jgi:hypothetical protein
MRGNRSCRRNAGCVVFVDEAAREIGTVQPDTRGPQHGRRDGKPVGLENLSRRWHLRGIRGSGKLNAGAVLAPRAGSVGTPVRFALRDRRTKTGVQITVVRCGLRGGRSLDQAAQMGLYVPPDVDLTDVPMWMIRTPRMPREM